MLTVRQALIDDVDQLKLNNLLFITAIYSNKSVLKRFTVPERYLIWKFNLFYRSYMYFQR